ARDPRRLRHICHCADDVSAEAEPHRESQPLCRHEGPINKRTQDSGCVPEMRDNCAVSAERTARSVACWCCRAPPVYRRPP
nr:hypothetical protein [Tanacetum cinerariifolium]